MIVVLLAAYLPAPVPQASAQAIMPDDIVFVDGPTVLQSGSVNYTVDMQLTLRGANYSGSNFAIYLVSSDSSLAVITSGMSVVSDPAGKASFNLTTGNGYGNVTVTASMLSPDGNVRASKTFVVTATGKVTGTVVEAGGRRISGATVTLYSLADEQKGSAVQISGNPATATGEGTYTFENVPYGSYVIEAVKEGYNGSANLTVASQEQSATVTIAGYMAPTPTPTPTPEPTLTPSEQPSPTATPVPPIPSPGAKTPTGDATKQLIWIVAIALVIAALIIGIQLLRQRKPKK
jgi:hypothetical protein